MTTALHTVPDSAVYVTALPGQPDSGPHARRYTRRQLAPHLHHDDLDNVEIVVSELVSNAVRHTGSARILLRLAVTPRRLRIEVSDCSREVPVLITGRHCEDEHGRGMHLVDTLSTRWGVDTELYGRPGKSVWADFHLSRPTPSPATTRNT